MRNILFKVCPSSDFQIISVRSVYIKIIVSILANLNKTMQTKQHAMKKHTPFQIETRFTREFFLVEGF